ncbi:MAG: PP2C family serine/threonine-protein phosphatase, partial [Candidatus Desantisbacteria bacterium]
IQQNNSKNCSTTLNKQQSSKSSYNYSSTNSLKGENTKLLPQITLGCQQDAVATPSQQTASPMNQSSQANDSRGITMSSTGQQVKTGIMPVNQPSKTQPNSEHSRIKFSITSNGMVNSPFHGKIEWNSTTETGAKLILREVKIPVGIGLSFNADNHIIQGTPVSAGEHKLKILYGFSRNNMTRPQELEGECTLIINPDPKTLWKQEPSDKSDPYWKKDEDSLTIQGDDGLMMVAVSKRGRSHSHVGSFRDDDFCLLDRKDTGWRILTVADGAGSAKKSRKGSLIASHKASEYVLNNLCSMETDQRFEQALAIWNSNKNKATELIKNELYKLFGHAAQTAVRAIEDESQTAGFLYKDYYTTLLMTIHKRFSGGHFVGAYWLGDGGIGLYRQGNEIQVLGKADSGEFAGQTRFLDKEMVSNAAEIWNRINFTIVPDFTALVVMTDGITDPYFETDANFENIIKWDQLWKQIEPNLNGINPEADMLSWLDFWSQGNHDDRTIAILCANKLSNISANMDVLHE